MDNVLHKVSSFLNYWYFRYTLVTELYMVEKWERNFMNIFLVILFLLFFWFNYTVVVPTSTYLFVKE